MSYDLYFYKKTDNPVSAGDIRRRLNGLATPDEAQGSTHWDYLNENTGAYCRFAWHGEDHDLPDTETEDEVFEGFESTGFSFSINFLRPDFFGYESFPLVGKLCSELDLYVSDPQHDDTPQPYHESLTDDWLQANRDMARTGFDEYGLSYLDKETSDRVWQYNFAKAGLQDELGDDVFVPRIMFVRKYGSTDIRHLTVWPQHIPLSLIHI